MGQWRVAQVVFRNLPRSLETTDYSTGPVCDLMASQERSQITWTLLLSEHASHEPCQLIRIFLSTSNYLYPAPSTIICSSPTKYPKPLNLRGGSQIWSLFTPHLGASWISLVSSAKLSIWLAAFIRRMKLTGQQRPTWPSLNSIFWWFGSEGLLVEQINRWRQ